jgi:signal transduction histidine kinase
VLDRGSGIDEAVRSKLFSAGMTTKAKGNGIGLTLARSLARQHGGEVELTDREGGGCVALVRLPGSQPAEEQSAQ